MCVFVFRNAKGFQALSNTAVYSEMLSYSSYSTGVRSVGFTNLNGVEPENIWQSNFSHSEFLRLWRMRFLHPIFLPCWKMAEMWKYSKWGGRTCSKWGSALNAERVK